MNSTQAAFEATGGGQSQVDKLRAHFTAHPLEWLAMPELALVITETGLGAAVHSRVSDCREKWDMCIKPARKHPGTGLLGSWYCYDPHLTWKQYEAERQNSEVRIQKLEVRRQLSTPMSPSPTPKAQGDSR